MSETDPSTSATMAHEKGLLHPAKQPEWVPALSTFADVMQRALYDPAHGYYGRGPRRIGRGGDFFTAVSVGPLYGKLLAHVAADLWERLGRPPEFTIIEQGAHDGQLAADLWQGWPGDQKPRFLIVEPQPAYRAAQEARLQPLMGESVTWVASLADLASRTPFFACFVCNELLDAFPVHRLRWTGTEWCELRVTLALEWVEGPLSTDTVSAEALRLPTDLPPGYTTEVHPLAALWMREVAALPFRGGVLIADYGYEAAEYYAPERTDGTLRRYKDHRSDGAVLQDLGDSDLTAHINFTRLIEEAATAGLNLTRFMEQGRFLTHAATAWLKSLEAQKTTPETLASLRQFQTLTHPTYMGKAFRILQLER